MQHGIAIGSQVIVSGDRGVVTGLEEDGRLIVALDGGDVIECDHAGVVPAAPADIVDDFTARQERLLGAGRACLAEVVETIEALSGEDQVGIVMMVCLGDANLRTKGAVVLSNMEGEDARATLANGLQAARQLARNEGGDDPAEGDDAGRDDPTGQGDDAGEDAAAAQDDGVQDGPRDTPHGPDREPS